MPSTRRKRRVVEATRDISEFIPKLRAALKGKVSAAAEGVVFHAPCSLQHAQQIKGAIESFLQELGVRMLPHRDGHLCCGSAGTYSILQPQISEQLRDRMVAALSAPGPEFILSANVGCIMQLGGAAKVPVRHWVEWMAEHLPASQSG